MSSSPANTQTLRIIHLGMIGMPSVFIALCFTVLKERMVIENETFYLVGLVFGIMASMAAFFIPSFLSKAIKNENDRDTKYQSIKIIQWGIIESGALLNAAFYYITGKQESIIISIILLIVLVSRFPSDTEKDKLFPQSNNR